MFSNNVMGFDLFCETSLHFTILIIAKSVNHNQKSVVELVESQLSFVNTAVIQLFQGETRFSSHIERLIQIISILLPCNTIFDKSWCKHTKSNCWEFLLQLIIFQINFNIAQIQTFTKDDAAIRTPVLAHERLIYWRVRDTRARTIDSRSFLRSMTQLRMWMRWSSHQG